MRNDYLRRIIELKARRRAELGDLTAQFECRKTVLFQIHEILRMAQEIRSLRVHDALAEYGPLARAGPAVDHEAVVPRRAGVAWLSGGDARQGDCSDMNAAGQGMALGIPPGVSVRAG